jgi:hypothetical protein
MVKMMSGGSIACAYAGIQKSERRKKKKNVGNITK